MVTYRRQNTSTPSTCLDAKRFTGKGLKKVIIQETNMTMHLCIRTSTSSTTTTVTTTTTLYLYPQNLITSIIFQKIIIYKKGYWLLEISKKLNQSRSQLRKMIKFIIYRRAQNFKLHGKIGIYRKDVIEKQIYTKRGRNKSHMVSDINVSIPSSDILRF